MISFTKVREITVSGFVADGDPNSGNSEDGFTFIDPLTVGGQALDNQVRGGVVKFVFVNDSGVYVPLGTVDFTFWYADGTAGGFWTKLVSEAGALANQSYPFKVVDQVFAQITAISPPSGGTKLRTYMAPRGSV